MRSLKISFLSITLAVSSLLTVPTSPAEAACKALPKSFGVDVGESTSYAWTKSGLAYSWGRGDWGMRGDNSTSYKKNKPQPVKVVKNVTKIASYGGAALFLQRDGKVFSTGYNSSGQLGIGSLSYKKSPVKISSLSCVVDIAAGRTTSYALRSDGTVWGWGYNADGELNVGNTWPATKPKRILGLSNIKSISAGEDNMFATKSDGTVYALGYNFDGQLGIGNDSSPEIYPASIGNLGSKSISVSSTTVATVNSAGELVAWGDAGWVIPNQFGPTVSSPQILDYGATWKSITLGWAQALAIDNNQALWTWGSNQNGALGAGLGTYCNYEETSNNLCGGYDYFGTGLYFKTSETPSKVLESVKMVAAGNDFAVAVQNNGVVWSWGDGGEGQLGNGYYYDSDRPTRVYKLNLNR